MQPSKPNKKMSRTKIISAIVLLSACIFVLFIPAGAKNNKHPQKNLEICVDASPATLQPISKWIHVQGTVEAGKREYLNFELPGKVTFVDPQLKEGDPVSGPLKNKPEGQLLATLDSDNYIKQVEIATVNLERAKQDAQAAIARKAQAQSQLRLHTKNYQRTKALYAKNIAPATELEQAQAQMEAAQSNLTETSSLIQSANSHIQEAQKNLFIAHLNLKKTKLRATFSGTLARINIRQGDYIQEGNTNMEDQDDFLNAAFVLISTNNMEAVFEVPLEHAKTIRKGQNVEINALIGKAKQVQGKVFSISPAVNVQKRTVRIKVKITSPDSGLLDGEPVKARIQSSSIQNALTIPRKCLFYENHVPFVFVVSKEAKTAKKQQISTGIIQKNTVQVVEGLTPGQMVVTKGQNRLFAGVKIRIAKDLKHA